MSGKLTDEENDKIHRAVDVYRSQGMSIDKAFDQVAKDMALDALAGQGLEILDKYVALAKNYQYSKIPPEFIMSVLEIMEMASVVGWSMRDASVKDKVWDFIQSVMDTEHWKK